MTDKLKACVDSYLDSFAQSFADNNYKPETIKTYRRLVQKLGQIMDTEGISPQALTPDIADKLAGQHHRELKVQSVSTISPGGSLNTLSIPGLYHWCH